MLGHAGVNLLLQRPMCWHRQCFGDQVQNYHDFEMRSRRFLGTKVQAEGRGLHLALLETAPGQTGSTRWVA